MKEVVVLLPYVEDRILMQLRDDRPDIVYPGYWGFFGGAVDEGELPDATAQRELYEEIGYEPKTIHRLKVDTVPDLGNLFSHSYYCPLTIPFEKILLKEGQDLGLFSLKEVLTQKLYSRKMKRDFPVVPTQYIPNTIKELLKKIWSHSYGKSL